MAPVGAIPTPIIKLCGLAATADRRRRRPPVTLTMSRVAPKNTPAATRQYQSVGLRAAVLLLLLLLMLPRALGVAHRPGTRWCPGSAVGAPNHQAVTSGGKSTLAGPSLALAETLGIEVQSLQLSVADTRLDFRYRVLDPAEGDLALRTTSIRLTCWIVRENQSPGRRDCGRGRCASTRARNSWRAKPIHISFPIHAVP
jgi:hypothetical protein